MRRLFVVAPLFAVLVAACDAAPTRPAADHAPAAKAAKGPDKLIGVVGGFGVSGNGWTQISLPFTPAAINDAGVIVGWQDSNAVRWENGTLTILPKIFFRGGWYKATAITPSGLIVGSVNFHAILWPSPSATPVDISLPTLTDEADPVAANDNGLVVGNHPYYTPWRWTAPTGLQFFANTNATVTGLSTAGDVSITEGSCCASQPVRWSAAGVKTPLPVIQSVGAVTGAMNGQGDIVGNSLTCVPAKPSCISTVLVWHMDGTLSEIFGAPLDKAVGLSSAGRIIGDNGWTYLNGVLTQLTTPSAYPAGLAPRLKGVNTCGSIVGARTDIPNAGYLWRRGSTIAPACDVTYAIL